MLLSKLPQKLKIIRSDKENSSIRKNFYQMNKENNSSPVRIIPSKKEEVSQSPRRLEKNNSSDKMKLKNIVEKEAQIVFERNPVNPNYNKGILEGFNPDKVRH